MNGRYLTAADKVRELARWEEVKAERPTELPVRFRSSESDWRLACGELGGLGFPDPEIYGVCDALNAIPDVCTLQSCAGHRNRDGSTYSGGLWLWLSEPLTRAFEVRVVELVRLTPYLEQVRKLWLAPDGQEIIDLTFPGQHSPYFESATGAIVGFFRDLVTGRPAAPRSAAPLK